MTIPGYFVEFWFGKTRWYALAKKEPFVLNPTHPIYEPGELWFESGLTKESAFEALKSSLFVN